MADRMHQLIAAKSTLKLGALHEATALQVRNYPYLIPQVSLKKRAATTIDHEHRVVEYACVSDSKFRFGKLSKNCCEKIHTTLKLILWEDVDMVLKVNGKVYFDTRKK